MRSKIRRYVLNFEDEDKEVELHKQRVQEALRKLQKVTRKRN